MLSFTKTCISTRRFDHMFSGRSAGGHPDLRHSVGFSTWWTSSVASARFLTLMGLAMHSPRPTRTIRSDSRNAPQPHIFESDLPVECAPLPCQEPSMFPNFRGSRSLWNICLALSPHVLVCLCHRRSRHSCSRGHEPTRLIRFHMRTASRPTTTPCA